MKHLCIYHQYEELTSHISKVAPEFMYHRYEALQWNLSTCIISRRHYMTTKFYQPLQQGFTVTLARTCRPSQAGTIVTLECIYHHKVDLQ